MFNGENAEKRIQFFIKFLLEKYFTNDLFLIYI